VSHILRANQPEVVQFTFSAVVCQIQARADADATSQHFSRIALCTYPACSGLIIRTWDWTICAPAGLSYRRGGGSA